MRVGFEVDNLVVIAPPKWPKFGRVLKRVELAIFLLTLKKYIGEEKFEEEYGIY